MRPQWYRFRPREARQGPIEPPQSKAVWREEVLPLLLWAGFAAASFRPAAAALAGLAFFCARGWLSALGVRGPHAWGGLLFAACGWGQGQVAHLQNGWLFVLPLALWVFARLEARPSVGRLLACAAALGWIAGWNLYFFVFAGLLLAGLGLLAHRRGRLGLRWLLPLVCLSAVAALPFVWPSLLLEATLGKLATLEDYPAHLGSLWQRCQRPALLGFYWQASADVEAAGGLGVVFTLLALRAAAARGQRAWLVAAGLAVWASFGAGAGLLTLLRLLPGVEALRATGRFQVLVPLLLLPPLVIWLGEQRGWRRALPLDRDFDALLVPATSTDWPRFSLRARAPGLLDHASLGSCSLVRTLSWGPLPLGSTRLWLDARSLRGPWLRAGEPGLELEPRQQWLRWPAPLRPAIALAVRCD